MTPRVEILFGDGIAAESVFILNEDTLNDETAFLGPGEGEWVDVTDRLLFPMTVTRGRSRTIDDFRAGTSTIALENSDGHFDPTNESSPYFGEMVPRRRIRISANGDETPVRVITGWIDDWNIDLNNVSKTRVPFSDAFALLGPIQLQEVAPQDDGDLSGERILRVLDAVQFPLLRNIAEGLSTFGPTTYGQNALAYIQRAATSENGWLYASRDGRMTFLDRHQVLSRPPVVVLADAANLQDGRIPYRDPNMTSPAHELFTQVRASREDGDEFVVQSNTDDYGVRTLNRTDLLLQDDDQVQALADYLISRFDEPHPYINRAVIDLRALDADQRHQILTLDLGDRVSVLRNRNGGGTISQDVSVDGIKHDIGRVSWIVTLTLGSMDSRAFMRLDDDVFGVLNANRVAY